MKALKWIPILLLVLAVFYFVCTTLIGIHTYFTVLPVFDTAAFVQFLDKTSHHVKTFHFILETHNEHRIILTKLVLLTDYYFLKGFKILPLSLIHLFNVGIAILLFRQFRPKTIPFQALLGTVFISLFFSLLQIRNFDSAFQLQFFTVNLLTTLSFISFSVYLESETKNLKAFVMALLFAFLAGFNMANGLFTICVLLVLSLTRFRWKHTLAIVLLTIIEWMLYFDEFPSNFHKNLPEFSLDFITGFLSYNIYFIGNVFKLGSQHRVDVMIFGVIGIIGGIFILTRSLIRWKKLSRFEIVAAAIVLFVLVSVSAAAYGRIHIGVRQSLAGRYSTTTVFYWASVIGYFLNLCSTRKSKVLLLFCIAITMVIPFAIGYRQVRLLHEISEMGEKRNLLDLALCSGVFDAKILEESKANCPLKTIDLLRKRKLSLFQTYRWKELRTQYTKAFTKKMNASFEILSQENRPLLEREGNGKWIFGGIKGNLNSHQFELINPENEIVGYAMRLRDSHNIPDIPLETEYDGYWVGYLGETKQIAYDLRIVEPLLHRYQHLLPKDNLPLAYLNTVEYQDFQMVPGQIIEQSGTWGTDAYYFDIRKPYPFHIIGSWDEDRKVKENHNVLHYSIDLRHLDTEKLSILLPIVIGPSTDGLKICINDPDSCVSYQIDLGPLVPHQWCYLNLSSFENNGRLEVEFVDEGGKWIEWIAFGEPFAVRNQEPWRHGDLQMKRIMN